MKLRNIGTMLMGVALVVGLAACGSIDDAVEVKFADICAVDDRWITSEGVLALGDQTKCESIGDSEECHIMLVDPDDSSQSVTVTIDVGDKANQMDNLPDSYSDSDLVVRDNAGNTLGVGDKARVTGTASNNEQAYACRVWVRRIEAVP